MKINLQNVDGVAVVSIQGSVDAMTAGEVGSFFEGIREKRNNRIVVDLGEVDFVSSAGLRVIMSASKNVRQMEGDLRLAAAQPGVERMLKISGFTNILKSYSNADEAVQSFGSLSS